MWRGKKVFLSNACPTSLSNGQLPCYSPPRPSQGRRGLTLLLRATPEADPPEVLSEGSTVGPPGDQGRAAPARGQESLHGGQRWSHVQGGTDTVPKAQTAPRGPALRGPPPHPVTDAHPASPLHGFATMRARQGRAGDGRRAVRLHRTHGRKAQASRRPEAKTSS